MNESRYYKDYQRWLGYASVLGYDSVDVAIQDQYEKPQSLSTIGKLFGVTSAAIRVHLIRLSVARRERGGANNSHGRKTQHYVGDVPLVEWCHQNDRKYSTIMMRIHNGATLREAVY